MATLNRLGLSRRTLVILTSDNGGQPGSTSNAPLRDGKGTLYEGGIRVPLILCWPGRLKAGEVRREPVMLTDLHPTILSAVGLKPPLASMDGIDLWPALSASGALPKRDLHFYYPHYITPVGPCACLRSGSWKFIEFYDPPHVELYNLAEDPGETKELASQSDIARQMKHEMNAWLSSVGAILHTSNPNYRLK